MGTVAFIALLCHGVTAQSPDDGYKHFDNSIIKLPTEAQPTYAALSDDALQRKMVLHFALETNNVRELEARVARGDIVSPAEMKEKYSGSEKYFNQLVTWLKGEGFHITKTSPDHTNVYASATVAQIEKSLGTKMVPVTYKGITGPAATTAPKLPHDIGDHVIAIDGLQPFVQAIKHTVPREEYDRKRAQSGPARPRPATATQPTYKVGDILKAYNADGLGVKGVGQVIAILIDTVPQTSDLQTFWKKNGLGVGLTQIQLINVQGAGTPLPPREGEETLDTEWASGIAPGATIRVYASGSLEYSYLDSALDSIYADAQTNKGLRQVSISLGLREDLVSPGEVDIEHTTFLKLAAIGVTVFVSSGDAGSNPDQTGHARSPDMVVEYESSDPATVAVGGTTLAFNNAHDTVVSETGWVDSGGGVSILVGTGGALKFPRPIWQASYSSISSAGRLVPDVSCVADPDPGAFVWLNGNEWPVGGTSWSTPVWAGFSALIAESRQKKGKPSLGFLAPVLYRLIGNQGFRDITSGSNGAYHAGIGWDPVTGIGVPNVKALILALP
jgi:kumamolisin